MNYWYNRQAEEWFRKNEEAFENELDPVEKEIEKSITSSSSSLMDKTTYLELDDKLALVKFHVKYPEMFSEITSEATEKLTRRIRLLQIRLFETKIVRLEQKLATAKAWIELKKSKC